ncbi:hypothetical protein [Desulfofalx alkaliphila]|uniref:hypothetical protein n=1 Tax=Desulfofalx alkaliphila TaxID=105483 RepID=UPI0004E0F274|nr:hypothetical protein [Desulfofalx alkaliphila]
MQRDIVTRLKSRKFLSAAFYTCFVLASEVFNLPISYEAYAAIGGVLGLYILGEAYTDGQHKN